jgi:hypothetical protein
MDLCVRSRRRSNSFFSPSSAIISDVCFILSSNRVSFRRKKKDEVSTKKDEKPSSKKDDKVRRKK